MSTSDSWEDFCEQNELLPGEFLVREAGGAFVAVYNLDGVLYGIEDVCTHDGGELAGGPIEGLSIECIRHGAKFDLQTGAALCAPAHAPVPIWEVRLQDGVVQVRPR
jgi:3-phenylpropionate/trans-cinnamate dioxygenase ferredoxin component